MKEHKVSFERYVNTCPRSDWILTVREAAGEKSACELLLGLNRKNKNRATWKTDIIEHVSSAAEEFFTFLSC